MCRDRFYIGTCCKLPSSGEEDDNLIDGSNHAGYISNEIDGNVKSKPKPKPTISSFAQGFTKFQTTFSTLRPFTKPSTTTTTTTTTTTSSTIPPIMDRLSYPDSAFFMPNGTLLISDPKLSKRKLHCQKSTDPVIKCFCTHFCSMWEKVLPCVSNCRWSGCDIWEMAMAGV